MAEYLIQEETLTNLGDKIRVLSGTEDTMTPSVMTTNVDEANSEISSQAELLAQAVAALEGKSAGGSGGSGGGASVETCTVVLNVTNASVRGYSFSIFSDGIIQSCNAKIYPSVNNLEITIENVVCGSSAAIIASGYNSSLAFSVYDDTTFDDYAYLYREGDKQGGLFTIGKGVNGIVTIDVFDDD